MPSPVLEATRAKRDKYQTKLDELLAKPTEEKRELTDDESAKFEELAVKIGERDKRIKKLEADEKRAEKAARAAAGVTVDGGKPANVGGAVVRSEPMTYNKHNGDLRNGGNSWMLDVAFLAMAAKDPNYNAQAYLAGERLARHHKEVDIELRSATKEQRRQFDSFMDRQGGWYEQRVNPNTTAGTGGEFVPPLWLVQNFAAFKRPGRIFADRCNGMVLPGGIDVINLPKITTGSLTGVQTAQGAGVVSQDIFTNTVSATVRTLNGQEDISMQLLEQSPLSMDGVIFDDLQRDLWKQLDTQILIGSNANGQHLGILSVASATVANNTANSTSASQIPATSTVFSDQTTTATQYRAIVNGVNQVETLYFDAPTAVWCAPRRANSWGAAADTTGRPLFLPAKYGQFNTFGTNESSPQAQGIAGEVYGLPVIKDQNMPTTCNGFTGTVLNLTGGTQDPVIVLDESQMWLWEGTVKLRALPEILSGTLQIRFQAYQYSAFMPHRFPTAISVLAGAGLVAPAF